MENKSLDDKIKNGYNKVKDTVSNNPLTTAILLAGLGAVAYAKRDKIKDFIQEKVYGRKSEDKKQYKS